MEDMKNYNEKIKRTLTRLVELCTKHRFILLFMILGTAVGFALIRTSEYIDVPRNETRFVEEKLKIKYKQIDLEALASFDAAQQDEQIEVGSQFNPNRNNPFVD